MVISYHASFRIIQLKYGCEGYTAPLEINLGSGQWKLPRYLYPENHTLTVLLYRYNTFMPVYLHLLSYFDHVNRKGNHTVSRLGHGSSPIFEEFLS